jgi:hypothetical protein
MRIPGLWRIENYLQDITYLRVSKQMDKNPRENYLIFGDPRGGTTWIAEVIQSVIPTSLIWEPLSIGTVKEFRNLNFGWRQFIPEEAKWPEAQFAFEKVFRGKLLNHWTAAYTSPEQLKTENPLLIKFCRGNQLLPWLINNFSFKNKPLYLIRHPFAVVASQLKQGGWNFHYDGFKIPEIPFNMIYKKHESFLMQLETKEESLVAYWCMTNQEVLNHPKNNKAWITVQYEDLVLNGIQSWKRIFSEWGIEIDSENIVLDNKSKTTVKGSPISGKSQVEYWTTKFDSDQISRMTAVLEYFEVKVYNENPYPLIRFS